MIKKVLKGGLKVIVKLYSIDITVLTWTTYVNLRLILFV